VPQNWKRDELVARILRRWRALTGDKHTRDDQRKTLVACSGGADSVALAFAISRIPDSCVIAHIRHDIRSEPETLQDQQLVKDLADEWGVELVTRDLCVRDLAGNLESNARAGRYAILQEIATAHRCAFIATGHHADDQLETLLMNMMRGSGIRGMSGMSPKGSREGIEIIRPMLAITHTEIIELLERAKIPWREDPTNADASLLRNRIRHEVLPVLRSICPEIAPRASAWASDLGAVEDLLQKHLDELFASGTETSEGIIWDRAVFRTCPDPVLGLVPQRVCAQLCQGTGQDTITRETIEAWIRAVKSDSTDPTRHRIGPMVCFIDAHRVCFERAGNVEGE
jgi:tRNA(Ile)-lysidine synthase